MHEMGIVMEIVDVVSAASHGDRVARIRLEIGALSMVAPEAMRLCVDAPPEATAGRQRAGRSAAVRAARPISSGCPARSSGSRRWR
jgi:Zn finger protein HypA/HybF involved in hydrogenase expression